MGAEKLVIAGTGRCGTTFLVQLLTAAGMDTGLVERAGSWYLTQHQRVLEMSPKGEVLRIERSGVPGEYPAYSTEIHAGCEYHIAANDTVEAVAGLPDVIKNPRLSFCGAKLIDAGLLRIRHLLLPVRSLDEVSLSKKQLAKQTDQPWYGEARQAVYEESAMQLATLVTEMTARDVPMTLMHFPRIVEDPDYLFSKLEGPCGLTRERFDAAFAAVAKPELVSIKETGEAKAYQFTQDWTKPFARTLQFLIEQRQQRNVDYLEIGVLEGRSAVEVLTRMNVDGGSYTGIDNWYGSAARQQVAAANIATAVGTRFIPTRLLAATSVDGLRRLAAENRTFDVIYIDGDHSYAQVLQDSRLAWPLLRHRGWMIWDDMRWGQVGGGLGEPGRAVVAFLKEVGLGRERAAIWDWQAAIRKPLPKG